MKISFTGVLLRVQANSRIIILYEHENIKINERPLNLREENEHREEIYQIRGRSVEKER